MFYKCGYLISVLVYLLYDLIFILKDSDYDYYFSIREHGVMVLLSVLLSLILLTWIKTGDIKSRITKGLKLSLFWNYLILILSNGFVIYITLTK